MPCYFQPSLEVPENNCCSYIVISGIQHSEGLSSELSNRRLCQNADTTFISLSFYNFCLFLGVFAVYLVTFIKENSLLFLLVIKGCFCLSYQTFKTGVINIILL